MVVLTPGVTKLGPPIEWQIVGVYQTSATVVLVRRASLEIDALLVELWLAGRHRCARIR